MSVLSAGHAVTAVQPPKSVKRSALAHIPGDEGKPIIGRTLDILADPKGEVERMAAKYGPIYRSRVLGETSITLLGPEANELVLFDQTKLFSSTWGWDTVLGRLFPRGLMLLDFEEHRLHRRALSVAFKAGPMQSYFAALNDGIAARVAQWSAKPGPMLFYPAMKQLTLDLAATSFLGSDIGPEVDEVTQSFVDMVAAAVSPVRTPLPVHPDAPRRQGPRADRRLLHPADSAAARARRRRPVLPALPGDRRRRRAAVGAGHRRPHELPDDGGARHADLVADVVRGDAGDEPGMADKAARRDREPEARPDRARCRWRR